MDDPNPQGFEHDADAVSIAKAAIQCAGHKVTLKLRETDMEIILIVDGKKEITPEQFNREMDGAEKAVGQFLADQGRKLAMH